MTSRNKEKNILEDLFSSRGRVRVLQIMSERRELNISAIARYTRLNYVTVLKHLNALKGLGIVEERRFGKIRIFRLKNESKMAQLLAYFLNSLSQESSRTV